ncbi:N-formylglutamate amidohydrolase [Mesorhizobium sp. L-8-3]|uniref:N-formylglutamate amidohydrolase n=1 Tax=Mesorhizobium sp. L-8-3 TaxID=2744522 RepID=UPI0019251889|nr:N-formylglutamate amidohydrolase [Mesorhizobium sp. L-8-3]
MIVNKRIVKTDPEGSPEGWTIIELGDSPVVGTAIHSGTDVGRATRSLMRLADADRRREEDPFTEHLIADFPTQIVVHRSRFEVDLNRAREHAVYLSPEQSWGLEVWRQRPSEDMVKASLSFHDAYYGALKHVLAGIERRYGGFVLVDVHSYNHRRDGPKADPASPDLAPDINIGTFSMDRKRWAPVVDPFIDALSRRRLDGRNLDVRSNVAFQGRGEQTRFVHAGFPRTGCAIAVEFKKIFMDEWSGVPDWGAIGQLRAALASTVPVLEQALRGVA